MLTVVVFNCGSSSLSYKAYEVSASGAPRAVASGKAHRVGCAGTQPPFIEHRSPVPSTRDERPESTTSHAAAAAAVLSHLAEIGVRVGAAGHRFVHGGTEFTGNELLRPFSDARERLFKCLPLAPIHNPISLSVIDMCYKTLGESVPQYVVFDTAFHNTIEPRAYTYALPAELAESQGYRKFGFHGLSYQYVTEELKAKLGGSLHGVRMVACHLGTGGSSACAVRDGRSVDTTMGWSPLPGLVMSTRTGDIDPSVVLALVEGGKSPAEVTKLLNNSSGLTGLTGGLTSDLRDVYAISRDAAHPQRAKCMLAWGVYVHRLVCAIGSLVAASQGIDVLAFTDDLGFDMPPLREAVCEQLGWLGVALDQAENTAATKKTISEKGSPVAEISLPTSRVRVFAVVNDEEIVIANEAARLLF